MCGISGIFDFASAKAVVRQSELEAMNAAIAHRGPDDRGFWSNPAAGIWLGHQRLSILDLSENGHQPMQGRDGSVIVFNGEIYNFRELRKCLRNQQFLSESDTEVLLRLYEQRRQAMLGDLNGMFALAIWDPGADELFLARDRIGIKPLYYTEANGVFAFSSELKGLLTLPWVARELDEEAVYHFLTFNKLSPPATMFKGIHKFHPGHAMRVGRNGIRRYEAFWEVSYDCPIEHTEEELAEQAMANLRRAVEYRMVSDVPVGAFLSGGVDSSAIVGLMSGMADRPVKTYSIGFQGAPNYDERERANRISEIFQTEHFEKEVSRQEIIDFLPHVVDIYDEPLADPTSIPIYFICRIAHEMGSKVVLTGDGADELYCGYRGWLRYEKFQPYFEQISKLPRSLLRAAAFAAGKRNQNSVLHEMLSRAASGQEFFWGGAGGLKESAKQSLISTDFANRMCHVDIHMHIADLRRAFEDAAPTGRHGEIGDWMTFVGVKDIIPNFYLARADRLGMAQSIELRVPFLDHENVSFAMALEHQWKTRGGEPKYLLKRALEGLLPRETLYRRKQGFCVPLDEWMGPLIVDYLEVSLAPFCRDTDYFNCDAVAQLISAARAGNTQVTPVLWNIYFFITWYYRWIDGDSIATG